MKIYSSRVDDLRREQSEYQARYQRAEDIRREQRMQYKSDLSDVCRNVESNVYGALRGLNALNFEVTASERWGRGLALRVECDERVKFEDSSALSWNFNVELDRDGKVKKETGSWSGLKATTAEQLESLRQTLKALEILNDLDWEAIIDVKVPDEDDYVTEPMVTKRDYKLDLVLAQLKEQVGKFTVCHHKDQPWGYVIVSETPKFFRLYSVFDRELEDPEEIENVKKLIKNGVYGKQVKKDESVLEYFDDPIEVHPLDV